MRSAPGGAEGRDGTFDAVRSSQLQCGRPPEGPKAPSPEACKILLELPHFCTQGLAIPRIHLRLFCSQATKTRSQPALPQRIRRFTREVRTNRPSHSRAIPTLALRATTRPESILFTSACHATVRPPLDQVEILQCIEISTRSIAWMHLPSPVPRTSTPTFFPPGCATSSSTAHVSFTSSMCKGSSSSLRTPSKAQRSTNAQPNEAPPQHALLHAPPTTKDLLGTFHAVVIDL